MNMSYLYNLQVYTGKFPGNAPEKNLGHRVVCDLMEPLFGTGRGVTTDNFFPSVPTAEFLLQKNITMTGTLRAKKPDIASMMEAAKLETFFHQNSSFQTGYQWSATSQRKTKQFMYFTLNFLMILLANFC